MANMQGAQGAQLQGPSALGAALGALQAASAPGATNPAAPSPAGKSTMPTQGPAGMAQRAIAPSGGRPVSTNPAIMGKANPPGRMGLPQGMAGVATPAPAMTQSMTRPLGGPTAAQPMRKG